MGYVAENVSTRIDLTAEHVLRVLLYRDDVRQNILDRTGISTSWDGLAGLLILLDESYNGSQSLFVREKVASDSPIRRLMRRINAYSGVMLWDVYPLEILCTRFRDIAYGELKIPPP